MQIKQFNFSEVEPQVRQALYDALGPHIAIGTEEVDYGRIFMKVVSPTFNGLSERKRQDAVWNTLRRVLGPDAQAVSLVLTFGTDEL